MQPSNDTPHLTPRTLIAGAFRLRTTARQNLGMALDFAAHGDLRNAWRLHRDFKRCMAEARFRLRWARLRIAWPVSVEAEQRKAA